MPESSVPLARLYTFSGVCALFGTVYGALELAAAPIMTLLLIWGPAIAVTCWPAADNKRTRIIGAYDAGFLFYLTWPLTMPWYAWRSRGRGGWSLAARLYVLALAGQLGYVLGATLHFFLFRTAGGAG